MGVESGSEKRRLLARLGEQLGYLPRGLRLVASASSRLLPLWLGLLVLAGLLPALSVHLTRIVVDALAAVSRGEDWGSLVLPCALLGAVLLGAEITAALRRWLGGLQAEKVGDLLAEEIQRQALGISLTHYDDADFYDQLHRARSHAQQHPAALLESGGSLLQNGLTLGAMAAVLLPFGWWWPGILIASTIPGIGAALWVRLEDYAWRRRTTAERRRVWYLDQLMSTREAAGELRALDLGPSLRAEYRRLRARLRDQKQRLAGRRVVLEMAAAAVALAAAGLVLVVVFRRLQAGQATLGEVALFAQAFYQGQKMMRSLLENAGDLYSHLFDLADFFAFLDLPREVGATGGERAPGVVGEPVQAESAEIAFADGPSLSCRGVRYQYPSHSRETARPALDDLDLELEGGLLHAIVGPNGAGKSTLIKLLAALLEPQAGEICIGRRDLTSLDRGAFLRQIAVMFQEPVRFQSTLLENISYGDIHSDPEFELIRRASVEAGADEVVAGLEGGYDTPLGAWFRGGRELSSGQWQKIALARACLRRAPLWLLDEPTSAMDLWSEKAFFERLRTLMPGRTVVLITHRPSAARHADRIHVLDAGRRRESGTPDELLEAGGPYAEMWRQRA